MICMTDRPTKNQRLIQIRTKHKATKKEDLIKKTFSSNFILYKMWATATVKYSNQLCRERIWSCSVHFFFLILKRRAWGQSKVTQLNQIWFHPFSKKKDKSGFCVLFSLLWRRSNDNGLSFCCWLVGQILLITK